MSLRGFTKILTTRFGAARAPPTCVRTVYNNIETEGFDTSLRDESKDTKMDPRKENLKEYSNQEKLKKLHSMPTDNEDKMKRATTKQDVETRKNIFIPAGESTIP